MQRIASCCIVGACLVALAQPGKSAGDSEDIAQTIGHGQVNWSDKTITVTGSGAPSLKAPNVAVARLGAERAAKMAALRNVLETVKGLRISGTTGAGDMMGSSPQLKAKVEGIVRNFKVMDTRYYSDGGVDVVVQVPLDGVLVDALVPAGGAQPETPAAEGSIPAGTDGSTGLIVNAKGLGPTPALAPLILDDKGKTVYGPGVVSRDAVQKRGTATYTKSLDMAMKNDRIADKPLVVRAVKLAGPSSADLVVGAEDAVRIAGLGAVLAQGRVVIVAD